MARRFTTARALLDDLLDRAEAGIAGPMAYPDHAGFPSVTAADSFLCDIAAAARDGAVTLAHGTGPRRDEVKAVRLADAAALYRHLGRAPARDIAATALAEAAGGLDLAPELAAAARGAAEAWARGKAWCGLGPEQAEALRTALTLAQAIVEGRHVGLDYRTFSRRVARDSKALERHEAAVLRLVGTLRDVPAGASPRAALSILGLDRFAPPLLLCGDVMVEGVGPAASLPYLGLPPGEVARLGFPSPPRHVLTVENYASFNRHAMEADPERLGLTVYVGGYPALATQRALRHLSEALPPGVPFFHWSDIDPDGTWIFRTVETAVARRLVPHLMSAGLAEMHGEPRRGSAALRVGEARTSLIGPLVDYLAGPDARHMEQEELDPAMPDLGAVPCPS